MEHFQQHMMESVPQMCRICFTTDSKMCSMTTFKDLNAAYESVTGIMTADEEHLPRSLCSECTGRLMTCARFRHRSLRAHLMLLDIYKRHGQITVDLIISSMNGSSLASDTIMMNAQTGSNNDDIGKLDKSTGGEKDKQNKDVNVYDKNSIKSEIDVVEHTQIDEEDRHNHIEIPVEDIKKEKDDLNNQEDLDTCSSSLDEDKFINKYDMMNEIKDDSCSSDSGEEIDVNNIIAKNDMINRDDLSVCSFTSEENEDFEVDIETIDNGIIIKDDEAASKKNFVYSARLYEDIVNYVLRKEYSNIVNNYSSTYKYSRDFLESQHSFLFVGEDVLSDPLRKQKVRKQTKRVMKTPKHLNGLNIKQQTGEADGHLTQDILRCDLCHYETANDLKFLEHLKAHAASSKSYNCDMCGYKTDRKIKIIWHIRKQCRKKSETKNTVPKLFSCDICYRTTTSRTDLNRHLRVHTGEKPFSCDICKKRFCRKSNVMLHLRIHSGQRPFSCSVCKKTFSRRYNLLEHGAIHTKYKPYSCDGCKKKYRWQAQLMRHINSGCPLRLDDSS